jgi:hypothetical protein
MYISIIVALAILTMIPTANVFVFAGGPRLDWPEDSTSEGKDCWVNGYDAGFAGKYDKARADRCAQENDEYNRSWNYACRDGGYTPAECNNFKNNSVSIVSESLQEENRRGCYDDGFRDGKVTSFDKNRSTACYEYSSSYEDGFSAGCRSANNTDDSCQILIQGYEVFCPDHPGSTNCVEFLHNDTNKKTPSPYGACAPGQEPYHLVCPQVLDPERYCLNTDDPAFCKGIGDLCDADGSVKPEDAYCKND